MARKPTKAPVTPKAPPELAAAEIVMNPETGAIIHAKNADVQRDPASLTKLMTAYMVMKAVEEGRIKLDDQIRISEGASKLDNNTLNVKVTNADGVEEVLDTLPAGSRLTVREALTVMMTSSANGVAKALGEHLAPTKLNAKGKTVPGSERDFAREMTRVAQGELGMTSSSFINASGLNNGGPEQKTNLSTARDMAVLSQRLMKDYPDYEKLLSTHTATTHVILPDKRKVRVHSPTTNHFVRDFEGDTARTRKEGFHAVGPQKTGFNRFSGGINLASTAENKDGVRLTSIVLGGKDSDRRYAANLKNLRTGFAEVQSNPQYAAVFRKPEDRTLYASVSPSSAFAEASKRERGNKRGPAATVVAEAESKQPRGSFNRASYRKQRERAPVIAPVAALAPVDLQAALPVDQVSMTALVDVRAAVVASAEPAPVAEAAAAPADPQVDAGVRGGSSIKPVTYRLLGQ